MFSFADAHKFHIYHEEQLSVEVFDWLKEKAGKRGIKWSNWHMVNSGIDRILILEDDVAVEFKLTFNDHIIRFI